MDIALQAPAVFDQQIVLTDMIGQEIKVGQFVVYYSRIYQVKQLGKPHRTGSGMVRMLLWNGGATARPVTKYSREVVVLDQQKFLLWKTPRQ